MSVQNESVLITKQTMSSYLTTTLSGYSIGYYLQKDPEKEVCEDALLVTSNKQYLLLAVCDGVGGSDRSHRAAKNILAGLSELNLSLQAADIDSQLHQLNSKLLNLEGSPQTTLTFVIIDTKNHEYICFQVGDSGLIHSSNHNNCKYKSPIHSPVGLELKEGKLTEQQALKHPDLHIVSNVLGCQDFYLEASVKQTLAQNDSLLLISDGLLDNFTTDEIINFIAKGDIDQACSNLYKSATTFKNLINNKNYNKIDDISFICLKKEAG